MSETAEAVYAKSIQHIITTLERAEKQLKPSAIVQLTKEAGVKPEDLKPWQDFEHPIEDSYGRKLIHQGDNFELLVMSWNPGDFSTIHDHGNTMWGAVQIFGSAEHATFRLDEDYLTTLARWQVNPGDVLGVSHSLIHQMGNPTDQPFVSLHIYGTDENMADITGDSRIFDLDKGTIQYHSGGVFFGLKANQVNSIEPGLLGDFATTLRHRVELTRRMLKMNDAGINNTDDLHSVLARTFSTKQSAQLIDELTSFTDTNGHSTNSIYWKNLNNELKEAAQLQRDLEKKGNEGDHFHEYATMYDALICQPMLDDFMANYLKHVKANYIPDLGEKSIISLGVGTGLIEAHMINQLGIPAENLYGIDVSEAMVAEASNRIHAEVGDVLTLDPEIKLWDIAYSGLNVFHYINHAQLEEAISKTANIIKPGGWFVGDFITPDHIRWYPNVMYSANKEIISLRTPRLIEDNGRIFQESEIINLDFNRPELHINYAGKHKRFLPPMHRIRQFFEKAFGGSVTLLDAYSLEEIPEWADTCASTRYVVIAQKR